QGGRQSDAGAMQGDSAAGRWASLRVRRKEPVIGLCRAGLAGSRSPLNLDPRSDHRQRPGIAAAPRVSRCWGLHVFDAQDGGLRSSFQGGRARSVSDEPGGWGLRVVSVSLGFSPPSLADSLVPESLPYRARRLAVPPRSKTRLSPLKGGRKKVAPIRDVKQRSEAEGRTEEPEVWRRVRPRGLRFKGDGRAT
ncbi:hypothetical protein MNBD_ACTINO01-551, partial [hydrothermal vent metagenome]